MVVDVAMLVFGLLLHRLGTVFLFVLSFWGCEFITMTPTRRGNSPTMLFLSLMIFTPLQYILIGLTGKASRLLRSV
ncbi:MAG: hypothetical protein U0905_15210 [Pirellulales bacterium]